MKTQCQFSIEDAKQLIEQNEIQVWSKFSKFFEYVFFAKTNQDDEPSWFSLPQYLHPNDKQTLNDRKMWTVGDG